jgi:hypothetical protein
VGCCGLSPEVLFRGAQTLDSIATELRTALRRLQSAVEDVVGVSCSGAASRVDGEHWSEFLSNAVSIVKDAQAIGQLVFYSAETCVYHEARATQELSAVNSGDAR